MRNSFSNNLILEGWLLIMSSSSLPSSLFLPFIPISLYITGPVETKTKPKQYTWAQTPTKTKIIPSPSSSSSSSSHKFLQTQYTTSTNQTHKSQTQAKPTNHNHYHYNTLLCRERESEREREREMRWEFNLFIDSWAQRFARFLLLVGKLISASKYFELKKNREREKKKK